MLLFSKTQPSVISGFHSRHHARSCLALQEAGGSARDSSIPPVSQKFRKISQTHKNSRQSNDIEWIDVTVIHFGHKYGESKADNRPDDKNLKLIHGQQYPFGLNLNDISKGLKSKLSTIIYFLCFVFSVL